MLNFKVVFNHSCCHGNYKNIKFYLSIKIFMFFNCQVSAFKLQSFSCNDLANDKTAKTVFSHLNKVQRDWQNLLIISRVCYIENLD